MELKQMTPAEFSAVYQERMTADFPADELRPLSSMKDLHAQGNYLVYGCYDEQGLAAYAALVLREGAALLDYYAVDASRRGQGVGQKCLSLLQKEPLGADFLLLEVESVESAQTPGPGGGTHQADPVLPPLRLQRDPGIRPSLRGGVPHPVPAPGGQPPARRPRGGTGHAGHLPAHCAPHCGAGRGSLPEGVQSLD